MANDTTNATFYKLKDDNKSKGKQKIGESVIEPCFDRESQIDIKASTMTKMKYIIGEFPPEQLHEAVEYELKTGIRPKMTEGSRHKTGGATSTMERYVALLLMYLVKSHGYGELEIVPDSCAADLIYWVSYVVNLYLAIQIKTTGHIAKRVNYNGAITWGWSFQNLSETYDEHARVSKMSRRW